MEFYSLIQQGAKIYKIFSFLASFFILWIIFLMQLYSIGVRKRK